MSTSNTVVLACRDLAKATVAQRAITATTGNTNVRAMRLDVASISSVREFAAEWHSAAEAPIDALVCNAGISRGPAETVDELDGVFETNHLGHFLLSQLLLDSIAENGRVISVSSDMHSPPGPRLKWPGAEVLAHPGQKAAVSRLRYSYSKLCNLYFSYEFSRRLRAEQSGISVAAFNPGLMTETNFARIPRPVGAVMKRIFASRLGSLETSSVALAGLAAGESPVPIDDHYFDRTDQVFTRSSDLSYNEKNARELWRVSSELTQL